MSKLEPEQIRDLVNQTHKDIFELMAKASSDLEAGQRFLFFCRVLNRVYQAHFKLVMHLGEQKELEAEIAEGK